MKHMPNETTLTGGNVNHVVIVGNTVRRQTGRHSKTIHEFLRHLDTTDVPAPRFMGIDTKGREILSFIDGESTFSKDLWRTDTALVASAKLLRKLHDVSLSFVASEPANWAFQYPDTARHEVICHNDFAPYNLVFRDGVPIGILDFDLCGPGPRLRDVAYLAYWMTPLAFASGDLQELSQKDMDHQCCRLRLLCSSYGVDEPVSLLIMVSEVLHHMADPEAAQKMVGTDAARRLGSGGHFDEWARQAAAFDSTMHDLIRIIA